MCIRDRLYVKQGTNKQFAILDDGMTDLIRPALYHAFHKIENITSDAPVQAYDCLLYTSLSRAVQKHIERKVLAYKNKTVIFN